MSTNSTQLIFQADPATMQTLQTARQKVLDLAPHYMNRHVSIRMVDGQTFEGMVVYVDPTHLHLRVWMHPDYVRHYNIPYNNTSTIMTLVLYELLVIALLA